MAKDFAQVVSSLNTSSHAWREIYFSVKAKRILWVAGIAFVLGVVSLLSANHRAANAAVEHDEWLPPSMKTAQDIDHAQQVMLRAGDTAVPALNRLGFSYSAAHAVIAAAKPVFSLAKLQAGHTLVRREQHGVTHLYYPVDADRLLHLVSESGGWQAGIESRARAVRRDVLQGVIRDNLFSDAAQADMDDHTVMNLVDIFAWDIDFVRDLRQGDRFRVLLEERFDAQGKSLGSTIIAAEFINQRKVFRAIRFKTRTGKTAYYTPNGASMRKTYLKAPVKFTRISSRFRTRRKHPILGYTRAHKGVDYAAPSGTPIHAVGDGRVMYAGRKGGYGRFILIRHTNSNHRTAYGHLSRYAHGIHAGVRVHQGQVIGYVGMSGLATGPHLHFEFRVRGRAINPLLVKRTPARPVPAFQRRKFRASAAQYLQDMARSPALLAWE